MRTVFTINASNIRLLDRNHGLINLRLSWFKDVIDIDRVYGTKQIEGGFIKIDKEKVRIKTDKISDSTIQKGIIDVCE